MIIYSSDTNSRLRSLLIVIIILLSFLTVSAQELQITREVDEALNIAKSGKFEQAIPVLKKNAEIPGFDAYKALEINIYLNLSYLVTKDKALDVGRVNELTETYVTKHGISKTDSLKSTDEMKLLYVAGLINSNVGNNGKMILFYSIIKSYYEVNHLKFDKSFSVLIYQLAQGYLNLKDYKSAIETGQKAWNINRELFSEKNEESLAIIEILYACGYSGDADPLSGHVDPHQG
ncbi:MAG: hypothetical protein WCL21_18860, partial [Mariniphaga sp.]